MPCDASFEFVHTEQLAIHWFQPDSLQLRGSSGKVSEHHTSRSSWLISGAVNGWVRCTVWFWWVLSSFKYNVSPDRVKSLWNQTVHLHEMTIGEKKHRLHVAMLPFYLACTKQYVDGTWCCYMKWLKMSVNRICVVFSRSKTWTHDHWLDGHVKCAKERGKVLPWPPNIDMHN